MRGKASLEVEVPRAWGCGQGVANSSGMASTGAAVTNRDCETIAKMASAEENFMAG